MRHHLVLHIVAKMLMPYIMVFALYVQFHGDYGPGGGFQAGVIFGAGFVIYGIIFGVETATKVLPLSLVKTIAAIGVLLYTGVGIASMCFGGEFLNYSVLLPDSIAGQHLGILLIELGVGITVSTTMVALFFSFATYDPDAEDVED